MTANRRMLTLPNEHGDITLSWTEEQDGMMREMIRKKMDEGYAFFIVVQKGRDGEGFAWDEVRSSPGSPARLRSKLLAGPRRSTTS